MIDKNLLLQLNIFEDNNYLDLYVDLINSHINRGREVYHTQRHHIIPRCYYKINNLKVDNTKTNMVNLLYKDHILAHYYLVKSSKDTEFKYKMVIALNYIVGNSSEYNYDNIDLNTFMLNLPEYQEIYSEAIKHQALQTAEKLRGSHRPEEVKIKISKNRKGKKHSEEARRKMSEAHKGVPLSEERKKHLSEKMKGCKQPWAGRKQSPEEIEKRRQKMLGHETSEETRKKISEGNKGKVRSIEFRKRLSEALKGREAWNKGLDSNIKGKTCVYNPVIDKLLYIDENDIDIYLEQGYIKGNPKASNARKGKIQRKRPIICLETGQIFDMVKDVSCLKGCSCVSRSLNNINITTNNCHWCHLDKLKVIELEITNCDNDIYVKYNEDNVKLIIYKNDSINELFIGKKINAYCFDENNLRFIIFKE